MGVPSELRHRRRVEAAAIEAAQVYARGNGFGDDKVAIGLVLAGMVIASTAGRAAQKALRVGYWDQHPDAARAMSAWAARLDQAAGRPDDA